MPVGSQPKVKVVRVVLHVAGGKRKLDEKAETTVKDDERKPYQQGHGNSNHRITECGVLKDAPAGSYV